MFVAGSAGSETPAKKKALRNRPTRQFASMTGLEKANRFHCAAGWKRRHLA
jgi:hypothetical protein